MPLVVTQQFHLGGVFKEIGDELTAAEEKMVEAEVELRKRCVKRGEAIVAEAASSVEKAAGRIARNAEAASKE